MPPQDESAAVERLYSRLVAALQGRSEPYAAPVTVAEIYQELVPYRLVRGDAGFAMNADYEHALLRLLSGEGDWARLEPPTARDVIARELKSPNPNVTMYREYAGCDVWIRPPAPGSDASGVPDEITDEELQELELLASEIEEELASQADGSAFPRQGNDRPADGNHKAEPAAESPRPVASEGPAAVPAQQSGGRAAAAGTAAGADRAGGQKATQGGAGLRCVFCDSGLPDRRQVRFCPFCGGDQTMVPCGSCGEALEPGWRYCISCGASSDED